MVNILRSFQDKNGGRSTADISSPSTIVNQEFSRIDKPKLTWYQWLKEPLLYKVSWRKLRHSYRIIKTNANQIKSRDLPKVVPFSRKEFSAKNSPDRSRGLICIRCVCYMTILATGWILFQRFDGFFFLLQMRALPFLWNNWNIIRLHQNFLFLSHCLYLILITNRILVLI